MYRTNYSRTSYTLNFFDNELCTKLLITFNELCKFKCHNNYSSHKVSIEYPNSGASQN